ncbi:cupin domain-containing protein [Calidithermus roseus]|uniref:Quercetin 2,3-dioxygenase n=1 Tax=Calidithermus roseus TaxID=1644118 RepID=A0A399ELN8_9DEIN|nr:cupin domain-containing protein [Calidithermus roseus]RIH84878.1 Quercetin 2,3-dioxygenase [Calidithermus roseus]
MPAQTPPPLERRYWCAGLYLNFLAEAPDTGGDFTLIEGVVRGGTEPPHHAHTYEDEALLVLEGELEVWYGGRHVRLGAGDCLMPRRQEHYFRCLTPQVRLLVKLSPGGLERGFKAFGVPFSESLLPPPPERVPDFPEIARIFGELGVYFDVGTRTAIRSGE